MPPEATNCHQESSTQDVSPRQSGQMLVKFYSKMLKVQHWAERREWSLFSRKVCCDLMELNVLDVEEDNRVPGGTTRLLEGRSNAGNRMWCSSCRLWPRSSVGCCKPGECSRGWTSVLVTLLARLVYLIYAYVSLLPLCYMDLGITKIWRPFFPDPLFGATQDFLRCRKCFFSHPLAASSRHQVIPSASPQDFDNKAKCHEPAETPVLFHRLSVSQSYHCSLNKKAKPRATFWCLQGSPVTLRILDSSRRRESLQGAVSHRRPRAQKHQTQPTALKTLAWAPTPAK